MSRNALRPRPPYGSMLKGQPSEKTGKVTKAKAAAAKKSKKSSKKARP